MNGLTSFRSYFVANEFAQIYFLNFIFQNFMDFKTTNKGLWTCMYLKGTGSNRF